MLNGVNPARGAPFFSASVEREPAQNFSDDNVIEHRDANVEVIMMQWLPFLNSYLAILKLLFCNFLAVYAMLF